MNQNTSTLIERVNTGCKGLDRLLSGGLPKGKSFLLSGEPGTGKTTLCMHYILTGLEQGENAIYVALDERPAHIIQDALEFGWDLKPYIDEGRLVFLDVSQSFTSLSSQKIEEMNVDTLLKGMATHAKRINAKRLIIDPIAPLVFGQSKHHIHDYIRRLLMNLDETMGTTSLLTSHITPGSVGLSQFGLEEFLVSGVIKLSLKQIHDSYTRVLFVRKMRSTPTDLTEYAFDIVPGKGVILRHAL